MPFLKTSYDGEVFFDHSASPGIPRQMAEHLGLPAELLGEGKRMYAPTLGCPHCGGAVILNPMRKRPRNHCFKCNQYICDGCAAVAAEPDYVHRVMKDIVDMVQSGKWKIVGGSASRPLLIPTGD